MKIRLLEHEECEKMISKLKKDLEEVQKNTGDANHKAMQVAQISSENKILYADKMNFFYVIQEIIKTLKKKKDAKLSHALKMLNKDED